MRKERTLPLASLDFQNRQDQPPESSFLQARRQFLKEAMDEGVFANKPEGMTRKVWKRWKDIAVSIAGGESSEEVARRYGKPDVWMNAQLGKVTGWFWDNSPEHLRRRIPKETILPTPAQIVKERKRRQDETIASQLSDPYLTKEQLRAIKPKVGEAFYRRHKELFMRMPKLIKESGLLPTTPADLAAEVLEEEGGVAVFSYRDKQRDGRVKVCHLVLVPDVNDSKEILRISDKLKDYRDTYR